MTNKKKKAPRQRPVVSLGAGALAATGAVMAGTAMVNLSTASVNDVDTASAQAIKQVNWTANSVDTVQKAVQEQGVSHLADYRVQWGDTLSTIAAAFHTTTDEAASELGLTDHGLLIAGQNLGQQADLIQKLQAAGYLKSNQQVVQANFGQGDQNMVIVQPGTPTISDGKVNQETASKQAQSQASGTNVSATTADQENPQSATTASQDSAEVNQSSETAQASSAVAVSTSSAAAETATTQATQSSSDSVHPTQLTNQQATSDQQPANQGQAAAVSQPVANNSAAQQAEATNQQAQPTTLAADTTNQPAAVTNLSNQATDNAQAQTAASEEVENANADNDTIDSAADDAVNAAGGANQAVPEAAANEVASQGVDSEAVINWFYDHMGQLTYDMSGSRNGSDGTADCSGSMTEALYEAGASEPAYLYNTDSLPSYLTQNGYQLIATNQPWNAQRGDIVIWGTPGASAGSAGHVQVMTDSQNAISVNYAHGEQEGAAVSVWNYQTAYAYNGGNMDYTVYRQ